MTSPSAEPLDNPPAAPASWLARWEAYWFSEVPPYSVALLRILFGALSLVALAGLTPVEMFWTLDGLSPLPSNPAGPRAWLLSSGYATAAGYLYFAGSVAAATAMTVGYRSDLAVLMTFVALSGQIYWNRLPLSSAHQVAVVVIFCLLFSETGGVWSLDAKSRAPGVKPGAIPVWPLRLIRFQVSLIYFSSALWKMLYPAWRGGSASYLAMNLNAFHRFPWPLPVWAEPALRFMTWGTLGFELLFPLLVIFERTRTVALLAGVGLHLGLFLTLEVGPFSWVMLASYAAFLDPSWLHRAMRRVRQAP